MANELRKGPSGPPFGELSSDSVANESDIDGATVTDALDSLSTRRIGYVNAASARVGTLFAGALLQAAPVAWLTEADVPPGLTFTFRQWGSGAGAGSGMASSATGGTALIIGGYPSGGGACNEFVRTRADILASLPIFFTCPLGGVGGASATNTTFSPVNGNDGANGAMNVVSCAAWTETAGGGLNGMGGGGTRTGGQIGSGGGRFENALTGNQGGGPYDAGASVNNTVYNLYGGARSNNRRADGVSGTLQLSIWGGAGGGVNGGTNIIVPGGRSQYGGSGGGPGADVPLIGLVPRAAAPGGNHDMSPTVSTGGGGAAGVAQGAAGQNGADGNGVHGGDGGGGGQGAVGADPSLARGGRGGNGGFPGGGAGGGAACHNTTGSSLATSGAGGSGGDALTLITISA